MIRVYHGVWEWQVAGGEEEAGRMPAVRVGWRVMPFDFVFFLRETMSLRLPRGDTDGSLATIGGN